MSKEDSVSTSLIVRFVWTDYCGVLRCKSLPVRAIENPVRVVCAAMNLLPWNALPSGVVGGSTGEVRLFPAAAVDSNTNISNEKQWEAIPRLARRSELPWHPNHIIVVSRFIVADREPWAQCPKAALSRATLRLRGLGLTVKAGFELEFALFHEEETSGERRRPFGCGEGFGLHDQFDRAAVFIDDTVESLVQMNIQVVMVHAEGGPGQFEIVLGHKDVFDAVQDMVVAKATIKAIARKHKLFASFVPSYGKCIPGNGCHIHLSLDDHFGLPSSGDSNDEGYGVTETGRKFMAGILDALPWLLFLLMSSPLSYVRLKPQCWVGAYKTWGLNNKEVPLRLSEDRTNFEVKLLDAISNPDLAVAGLLLAGLEGISEEKELPPPCQVDPHLLSEEERPPLLPTSLVESMAEFKKVYKQGRLRQVFTDEMIADLAAVKNEEIQYAEGHGEDSYRDLLMRLH